MHRLLCAVLLGLAVPSATLAQGTAPHPVISEIVAGEATRLAGLPGVVAAEIENVLAFQTTGRLATRTVNVGDRVSAGNILATLDQISLADDVASARAALDAAQAQAALARQTLERTRELSARGISATASLETAIAARDSAEAAVIAAEASLTMARDAERHATLRAPGDGVVIKVSAEPGAVVAAGMDILTLAAEESLEVIVNVPPEMLVLLPPEARFLVRPRANGARPVPASLRLIEPVADKTTRSHRVRIRLEAQNALLRIGSLVEVVLDLPADPILTVPLAAVRDPDGAPTVWRISPATRKAESVAVTLGARAGDRVIVATGLAAGDEILVRGINSITEGQTLGQRIH